MYIKDILMKFSSEKDIRTNIKIKNEWLNSMHMRSEVIIICKYTYNLIYLSIFYCYSYYIITFILLCYTIIIIYVMILCYTI